MNDIRTTWDAKESGSPIADININGQFDISQIQSIIDELKAVQGEMKWEAAEWVESVGNYGKSHLFSKDSYLQNKQCPALCGIKPNGQWQEHWSLVPIIDGKPNASFSLCQKCHSIWLKKQA